MDEDHELRNETSSLKSMFSNLISNRTETENQITTCTLNNNNNNNRNKKSRKDVCIIGDSMVKHITGSGISKIDHAQVKTHPGATTDDIIKNTHISMSTTSLFKLFKMFMFIAIKSRYCHKSRQYSFLKEFSWW